MILRIFLQGTFFYKVSLVMEYLSFRIQIYLSHFHLIPLYQIQEVGISLLIFNTFFSKEVETVTSNFHVK